MHNYFSSKKGTLENDNTFPKTRRHGGRSSNKNPKDRFVSPKDRTSSTFHFNDNSNILCNFAISKYNITI